MPTVQIKQVCDTTGFNDFASPIAITASTWGPTDGHFEISPYGLGVGCAIRIERITLITSATNLTSCKCSAALDGGNNAIVAVWNGTVTLKAVGAYTVSFEPKTLVVLDHQPQSLLDMLSMQVGALYLQFYSDVNMTISGTLIDYTIETVRPT